MERALNVFILNDNAEIAGKLRKYLTKRFGNKLDISLFFSHKSCMKMIDNHVDLVVVDDYLESPGGEGRDGVEALKQIKEGHPHTEVLILSSNEDVGLAIEAYKSGAREYILNKRGAWHRILTILDKKIKQPIRNLIAEYGVKVFVSVFLLVFVVMGVVTHFALKYLV